MQQTKPIFEFLLWDNCNNNCKFCHQKQNYHKLNDAQKIASIDKLIEFVNSTNYVDKSHVLLVGGEIFDSCTIYDDMCRLIVFIIEKMNNNSIDLLYINTNLIYKKLDLVEFLLQMIAKNDLFERLKFTTSYDVDGRFNEKTERLMLNNLAYIKNKYPNCNIVVNMMLTHKLCSMLIDHTFSVKNFCNKYHVNVNLIPYIILDPSLSAPRNKIFKALLEVNREIPDYLKSYIQNFDLDQDKILHRFNEKTGCYQYCSCDKSPCNHSENFKNYSNNNTCFVCDIKELYNGYL